MVDAAKAFSKEPPWRPLIDLPSICEDFQWRYVERKKTDQVIEYCRQAEHWDTAVQRAVEARDADGKHHNHQSKVDITARRLFGRRIVNRAKRGHMPVDNFDEFHDYLHHIRPYGIGPVTVYDVAVRIGAYLGIEPQSVYMHAGVRQGFKAMAEAMDRATTEGDAVHYIQDPRWRRADRIPIDAFQRPLNKMRADDVEDILCTYRQVFEGWAR